MSWFPAVSLALQMSIVLASIKSRIWRSFRRVESSRMPQITRSRIMHGLLHVSELAGPRQAPNLTNENVESFVCVLRSLVEDVALVGYIHRPHTELFERIYKFRDILLVIRWEGEATVRVVSLSP